MPLRKAAKVFSGSTSCGPRWAMTTTLFLGAALALSSLFALRPVVAVNAVRRARVVRKRRYFIGSFSFVVGDSTGPAIAAGFVYGTGVPNKFIRVKPALRCPA